VATYTTKVPADGTTVEIPMKAEWGAGAYALVTAWRPLNAPAERTPTRADRCGVAGPRSGAARARRADRRARRR